MFKEDVDDKKNVDRKRGVDREEDARQKSGLQKRRMAEASESKYAVMQLEPSAQLFPQVSPTGEFTINQDLTSNQFSPSADGFADKFVVAWGEINMPVAVNVRVFNARNGLPLTNDLDVELYPASNNAYVQTPRTRVSFLNNGGFVVTWIKSTYDGQTNVLLNSEIKYRIYDNSYQPLTSPITAYTFTNGAGVATTGPSFVDVTTLTNGNFVIVWDDRFSNVDSIYGKMFDSSGMYLTDVQLPSSSGTPFKSNAEPSVSASPQGGFVVVWKHFGGQTSGLGTIKGLRFDNNGVQQGTIIEVNTPSTSSQMVSHYKPDVSYLYNGDFIVVWIAHDTLQDSTYLYRSRFDSTGSSLLSQSQVDYDAGPVYISQLNYPHVDYKDFQDDYVISWSESDNFIYSVSSVGGTDNLAPTNLANPVLNTGNQFSPFIAAYRGGYVVVWSTTEPPLIPDYDIHAQRYTNANVPI